MPETSFKTDPLNSRTEELQPIFIGGTGRSGTTILANILQCHSKIFGLQQASSGSMEGRFITSANGLLPTLLSDSPAEKIKIFEEQFLGKWYREETFKGNGEPTHIGLSRYISDIAPLEKLTTALKKKIQGTESTEDRLQAGKRFIEEVFVLAASTSKVSRIVEKTPANILYIPELTSMFPKSKFIHIYRDGRDVAASILEKEFWPIWGSTKKGTEFAAERFSITEAARYWQTFLSLARTDGAKMPPDRYLELSLEELLAGPEEKIRQILEFIGEDFEPELLRIKLNKGNVQRWRTAFSEDEKALFNDKAGDLLIELGYELDDSWQNDSHSKSV